MRPPYNNTIAEVLLQISLPYTNSEKCMDQIFVAFPFPFWDLDIDHGHVTYYIILQCPSPLPDASVTVKGSKFCKPNYIFNSSC